MHVITYVTYWIVVIGVVLYKRSRGTLDKYQYKEEDLPEDGDLEAPAGAEKVAGEAVSLCGYEDPVGSYLMRVSGSVSRSLSPKHLSCFGCQPEG